MVDDAAIDAVLTRRNLSPVLIPRVQRLLDGREDRTRLRCCHSGCFVCVHELQAVLHELEGSGSTCPQPPGCTPRTT